MNEQFITLSGEMCFKDGNRGELCLHRDTGDFTLVFIVNFNDRGDAVLEEIFFLDEDGGAGDAHFLHGDEGIFMLEEVYCDG